MKPVHVDQMADLFGKILSLCQRRGFLVKLQQTKDGCHYVYGPLGAELKRNIVNEWWHAVVTSSNNVHGLDSKTFPLYQGTNDALTTDSLNGETVNGEGMMSCVLQNTKNCMDLKPPFGIAQVGQAMHKDHHYSSENLSSNPISCDNERLSVQFLSVPAEEMRWFSHWHRGRLRWWRKFSRNPEQFSVGEEGAPKQQCNIQYAFPWGTQDVESISSVGKCEWSSDNLSLVSMGAGVNRAIWAYLCDAYSEVERPQVAAHAVLKLHVSLAPYKVAVLPTDEDNTKLCMYCRVLCDELKHAGISTTYCDSGSLSDRLILQDELGTPYRVLAKASTLESGIVTLQDRDTTGEEDMNGKDVLLSLHRMLFGARIN